MPIESLHIRRTEPDDFEAIYEIFSCQKVVAQTLQLPYPSREHWRHRLANPEEGTYSLVAVCDDRVIGNIVIHTNVNRPRRRHVGSLAMAVHDQWQGKGVGTALMRAATEMADKWLNLTRLELEVYTDNEPAIRLYQRFGFETEGRLRQHAFRDGIYVDSFVMGRIRKAGEKG